MKFALPFVGFPLLASAVPLGHLNKLASVPLEHTKINEEECYKYIEYCVKLNEKMSHIGIPNKKYVCPPQNEDEKYNVDCLELMTALTDAFRKEEMDSEAYFNHDENGGKEPEEPKQGVNHEGNGEEPRARHHGVNHEENGEPRARHHGVNHKENGEEAEQEHETFVELEQAVGTTIIAGSPLPVREHRRWPALDIPYCIDASLTGQLQTKMGYLAALKLVADNTNIDLNQVACNAPGHKLKLIFHNNEACSFVGIVRSTGGIGCGGAQGFMAVPPLAGTPGAALAANTHQVLAFDFVRGNCYTAAHELLHTLGFYHTQMRSDRDTFVTVERTVDNINCGSPVIYGGTTDNTTDYDLESIMHYPRQSGQCGRIDVKDTAPQHRLKGVAVKMGQMNSWRDSDTAAVNAAYPLPVG